MNTENNETPTLQGGPSYPNAMNALPESANEREISEDFIDMDDDDENETSSDKKENTIPKAKLGKQLDDDIIQAAERVTELREDLKITNKHIKQVFTDMEQKGILAEALKHTINSVEWSDAKRAAYSLGCSISGNALGVMEQTELFSVK